MKRTYGIDKYYRELSIPAKASIWYAIGNFAQKGISFLVVPIYVRLLSVSEYGKLSVFLSWKEILLIFATLNLYCGVFTKAMVDYEDDRDRYTSSMQGLSTSVTLILVFLYLAKAEFWTTHLKIDTVSMLLLFVYFITYPAFSFWAVRQRVEYHYKIMVSVTLLVSVLIPFVSILLLYLTNLRELSIIWGTLVVQICFSSYFYVSNFSMGKTFYYQKYWKHALKFNIPLIPHYLSLIVLGQSDRIMIQWMRGDSEAGMYSLAYQISMIMTIFVSAINNSLVPWVYERLKIQDTERFNQAITQVIVLVGGLSGVVMLVSPEIVKLLGTREYYTAIWVMPAIASSVFFTFCYSVFSTIEFYYSKTIYVTIASMVGAIINILLNVVFINKYGFIAAGYTTLVSYIILMLMHFLVVRQLSKTYSLNLYIIKIKFLIVSVTTILLLMVTVLFLYRNGYFRYFSIAIISIFAVVNWRKFRRAIAGTITDGKIEKEN